MKILIACLFVYGAVMFGFGMFLQLKADQSQLKKFTDAAWTEGCRRCAEFEKQACNRDQLQGIIGATQIP